MKIVVDRMAKLSNFLTIHQTAPLKNPPCLATQRVFLEVGEAFIDLYADPYFEILRNFNPIANPIPWSARNANPSSGPVFGTWVIASGCFSAKN